MFTGIIEKIGEVLHIEKDKENIHVTVHSEISNELKIDQSIAHDGVCLTVVEVGDGTHKVTAIKETLEKSNLRNWKEGTLVNLERCMVLNGRLDGHIVQGHVDGIGKCIAIEDENGSFKFSFEYASNYTTVEKGSICINGVSLTVVDSSKSQFSVCIIPYTLEHTSFKDLEIGNEVNLEFDIIGKYVAKLMQN